MFQTITLLGSTIKLYDLFNNIALVAQVIFFILTIKEYKNVCTLPIIADKYYNKKRKNDLFHNSIFAFIEIAIIIIITMVFVNLSAPVISKIFLGVSDANFFSNIFVSPLTIFLLCILFKASPLKAVDYSTPIVAIALIFFKIACYFEGCCYGIEYNTHFFNHNTGRYEIPVQLIELACAIVIFAILLILRKKKKRDGLLFPSFILMYCGLRFCSEFLRGDYPQIVGPMTGYHIQCIIGFVLGLVYLFIVLKFGSRITEFFETKNKAFLDKKLAQYNEKHAVTHHKKRKK